MSYDTENSTRTWRQKALSYAICLCLVLVTSPSWSDPKPDRLVVVSWNLEWFFDAHQGDNFSRLAKDLSAPNDQAWQWKLTEVAKVIAGLKPTILALQEVESKRTLHLLANELRQKHQLRYRVAFIEGFDRATEQDVGILFQSGLVEMSRREQSSEMFRSRDYYNLSKHLFARFEWGQGDQRESLLLGTAHFRAGEMNRELRQRQARLLGKFVEPAIKAGENVVVLGDFNVERKAAETEPTDPIGILCKPGLTDLHLRLQPNSPAATHLTGKQFDRILVSQSMLADTPNRSDLVLNRFTIAHTPVVRGRPDTDHRPGIYTIPVAERDISDHYPLVAVFDFR